MCSCRSWQINAALRRGLGRLVARNRRPIDKSARAELAEAS